MKKILITIGLLIGASTLFGYKKVTEINNTMVNLTYKIKTIKQLDIPALLQRIIRFKLDLMVTNPSTTDLDVTYITINKVDFYLPSQTEPFAQSNTLISNIKINKGETITLNNIDVQVTFESADAIKNYLLEDGILGALNKLKQLKNQMIVKPEIEILGQTYVA